MVELIQGNRATHDGFVHGLVVMSPNYVLQHPILSFDSVHLLAVNTHRRGFIPKQKESNMMEPFQAPKTELKPPKTWSSPTKTHPEHVYLFFTVGEILSKSRESKPNWKPFTAQNHHQDTHRCSLWNNSTGCRGSSDSLPPGSWMMLRGISDMY